MSLTAPSLSTLNLPFSTHEVFLDSSFFKRSGGPHTLPSPAEVRKLQSDRDRHYKGRPPPVSFPELGVIVKLGSILSIAEGQCMWALRRLLPDIVRVPEVYGWCEDDGQVFMYMELVEGETLEKRWDSLNAEGKTEICLQLRGMVDSWRTLVQNPHDQFIGTHFRLLDLSGGVLTAPVTPGQIGREPCLDIIFDEASRTPYPTFPSVASFHNCFSTLYLHGREAPPDPRRRELPDDVPIVFTHGDLHRSNIIVSPSTDPGPPRVLAVVDWHQSGWYPEYWEYCKARWTTAIGKDEWEVVYLPKVLQPFPACYDAFEYFVWCCGM